MKLTDPPCVWAVAALAALDDAFMLLEARASDPYPYTVARTSIAIRLEELGR